MSTNKIPTWVIASCSVAVVAIGIGGYMKYQSEWDFPVPLPFVVFVYVCHGTLTSRS